MARQHIDRILRKYFTGNPDREERDRLSAWLSAPENRDVFKKLKEAWQESSEEQALRNTAAKIDELWAKGVDHVNRKENTFDPAFYIRAAAIVCVLLISGFAVYRSYYIADETPEERTVYLVKENPSGQKTKFYLPDGSEVWLNSASSLKYRKEFQGAKREVELSGEAYFEVAKHAHKPFIVTGGNFTVTAVGTAFNLHFYEDEPNFRISLIEGEVLVDHLKDQAGSVTLTPGYEIFYSRQTGEFLERQFVAREVLGWKEGSLVFKGAEYEEVVGELEKWFGVTVRTIGSPVEEWKLTTTYTEETLVNILEDLKYSKDFSYELNKKDLTIKF